jgi:hypothetical protein
MTALREFQDRGNRFSFDRLTGGRLLAPHDGLPHTLRGSRNTRYDGELYGTAWRRQAEVVDGGNDISPSSICHHGLLCSPREIQLSGDSLPDFLPLKIAEVAFTPALPGPARTRFSGPRSRPVSRSQEPAGRHLSSRRGPGIRQRLDLPPSSVWPCRILPGDTPSGNVAYRLCRCVLSCGRTAVLGHASRLPARPSTGALRHHSDQNAWSGPFTIAHATTSPIMIAVSITAITPGIGAGSSICFIGSLSLCRECEGRLLCVQYSEVPTRCRLKSGGAFVPTGTKLSLHRNSPLFAGLCGPSTQPHTSRPSLEKMSEPASDGLLASSKRRRSCSLRSSLKCSSGSDACLTSSRAAVFQVAVRMLLASSSTGTMRRARGRACAGRRAGTTPCSSLVNRMPRKSSSASACFVSVRALCASTEQRCGEGPHAGNRSQCNPRAVTGRRDGQPQFGMHRGPLPKGGEAMMTSGSARWGALTYKTAGLIGRREENPLQPPAPFSRGSRNPRSLITGSGGSPILSLQGRAVRSARRAHNAEVVRSNRTPATIFSAEARS